MQFTIPDHPSVALQSNHSQTIKEADIDFGLERAELEMILALRNEEGQKFEDALRYGLAVSGNTLLFGFPADKFPIAAKAVFAICLQTGSENGVCYVYECAKTDSFFIADTSSIDQHYLDFATNYANLLSALNYDFPSCGPKRH